MAFQRWVTSHKVWRAQRNKPLVLAGMAAWDGAMRRVRTMERRERWQGAQASYRAIAVRWRRAERVLSRYDASVRGALVQAWAEAMGREHLIDCWPSCMPMTMGVFACHQGKSGKKMT